jgi:hypothetical protein
MAKTTKPTKQQIAQAKARAGGNNPVKVTNAGLKKLGSAALIAASFTPAGRVAKVAATAAKATKAAKAAKSSRQAGDYAVSGRSANRVIPNVGRADAKYRYGRDMDVSKNLKIKDAVSPSGKTTRSGGVLQVTRQNDRLANPLSRAEAKANARGLRAANKKTNKVGSKSDKEIRSRTKSVTLNKEETATLNDYYYGQPDMVQVMSRRTPVNEASSVRKFKPTPKKKSATQLRPKKK